MPGTISESNANDGSTRLGVYHLTHPRSASNLLQRMMSEQPGYQSSGYKFFDGGFNSLIQTRKGPMKDWAEEERNALYDTVRDCWQALQDEIADAKKNGKQVFIKEHVSFMLGPKPIYDFTFDNDDVEPLAFNSPDEPDALHTNITVLPDNLLLSMQPIFQIRHPAKMFPSLVKATGPVLEEPIKTRSPVLKFVCTLRFTRAMYDWYISQPYKWKPIILDADDIMEEDHAVVKQLCKETGLDADAVLYEWEERTETDPRKQSFLSTINASKGIVKGLDAKNLDFAAEKAKWKAEYGEETAEDLERMVKAAMPDYEYLLSKRIRAN